jgi:hypothetical protein
LFDGLFSFFFNEIGVVASIAPTYSQLSCIGRLAKITPLSTISWAEQ